MFGSVLGFVELGAIVLAWMIIWNFIFKPFTALHAGNPAADGFAAVFHA
jgi:hypothetical protein